MMRVQDYTAVNCSSETTRHWADVFVVDLACCYTAHPLRCLLKTGIGDWLYFSSWVILFVTFSTCMTYIVQMSFIT